MQKSEKIAEEELKCRKMAEVAQADLAEALPGLEEAKKVLSMILTTHHTTPTTPHLTTGVGVVEQEGHNGDQVVRQAASAGGEGAGGGDDLERQ